MDTGTRTPERSRATVVTSPATDRGLDQPARDAFLDNAKALLIVLVVIGHAIEIRRDTFSGQLVYTFLYSFHMPAFILISGYLSRRFRATPRSCLKIVTTLIAPYLIIQALLAALTTLVDHKPFSWDPLEPAWTLWFLVAMATWRAITALLRRVPLVLPLSIVVSIGVGFLGPLPSMLALNRTVVLLPFFVLGLVLQPRQLEMIKQHLNPSIGWTILAMLAVIAVGTQGFISNDALYFTGNFAELGNGTAAGLLLRLLTLVTGLAGSVAILAITPRRRLVWTYLGRWSMYIYLLHGMVIMAARSRNLLSWPDSPLGILVIGFAAVALAALLASPPVRKLTSPLVQPPLEQLIKDGKVRPISARGPSTSLDSTEAGAKHPISKMMRARQSPVDPGAPR